jgi:cytochrome c biogenesis protein CcdA
MRIYCLLFLTLFINVKAWSYQSYFKLLTHTNPIVLIANLPNHLFLPWQSPSNSNKKLSIDLSSSENITNYQILWPWPNQLEQNNTTNYVLEGDVAIPISLNLLDKTKPTLLNIKIDGSICKNEHCAPYTQIIKQKLDANLHTSYLAKVSFQLQDPKFINKHLILKAKLDESLGVLPKFMLIHKASSFIITSEVQKIGNMLYELKFAIDPSRYSQISNQVAEIYSNISDLPEKIELPSYQEESGTLNQDIVQDIGILKLILLSLAGGMILNFMPCILPVLSLKLISLTKANSKASIMWHILGIFTTFNVISIGSLGLQNLGEQFSFGMQFQNPKCIIVLAICLVFLISLSTEKLNFNLPNVLASKLALINSSSKYLLDFINGVITAVLSTSCSAPFLGIAIGIALSSSAVINILIFNLISIGFCFPYILLLLAPKALKLLPKSGLWLIALKRLTSLMLIATLIWLVYILYQQLSTRATVGFVCLLILFKAIIEGSFTTTSSL